MFGLRFKTCVFWGCGVLMRWVWVRLRVCVWFYLVLCDDLVRVGFSGFGVSAGWFSLVVCTVGYAIVVGTCGFGVWCGVDIIY